MAVSILFYHAEDGIRARDVTGVQTCALPIFKKGAATPAMTNAARPARSQRHGMLRRFMLTRSDGDKIGRASCRERVEARVAADALRRGLRGWRSRWSRSTSPDYSCRRRALW